MSDRTILAFLIVGASLATASVLAAEPTEEMRSLARLFATLEARDQQGYCAAMHGSAYADYLSRVCQSAVQNNLKKPADCTPENIKQQLKADATQCLAMPAREFDKIILSGVEGRKLYIKQMKAQGIDGEELLQVEKTKLR